jgi:hypothetical protein
VNIGLFLYVVRGTKNLYSRGENISFENMCSSRATGVVSVPIVHRVPVSVTIIHAVVAGRFDVVDHGADGRCRRRSFDPIAVVHGGGAGWQSP